MPNRYALAFSLLLSWFAAIQAPAAVSHVRAELLADVSAISPGKPFMLGVRLRIDPGWHVYWKNPGDAGAATLVKFDLPTGFSAGPLQYPTPHRFDQPGDIVAFGYENSVLLLAQITPPKDLPADFHAPFKANVSWLVCAQVCIPGKDSPSLALGVSSSPIPANTELFNSFAAQLPMDIAKSPDATAATSVGEIKPSAGEASGKFTLTIDWKNPPPMQIQFLPGSLDNYNIKGVKVDSQSSQTRITFAVEALAGKPVSPATLEVVIGYEKEGAHRGVITTVTLPKAGEKNAD